MQPPKRQIIKTRPQRPYIIARVVLVVVILAAILTAAYFVVRGHAAHALSPRGRVHVALVRHLQDDQFPKRMAPIQLSVERRRS